MWFRRKINNQVRFGSESRRLVYITPLSEAGGSQQEAVPGEAAATRQLISPSILFAASKKGAKNEYNK